MNLKHGSLFTGYGGFDLAADWCGWATIFQCENNNFCRNLLRKNFAGRNIELYNDIKKFNAEKFNGTVNVISGGDPCQPHSLMGRRKGTDDIRFLWPEYLRIIKEVQPLWAINENVRGSISNRVLDSKISDLEAEGYTCWPPLIIPAAATGAIHKRERVLLVSYANGRRWREIDQLSFGVKKDKREISGNSRLSYESGFTRWDTSISGLLREADGTAEKLAPSERNGGIKAGGNGVAPLVVYGIFKEIDRITEEYFNQFHQAATPPTSFL